MHADSGRIVGLCESISETPESRANRKLTHYPKGHLPLTTRWKARPDIRSEKYVFSRSPTRQGCCVTSISPGLIDVGLHFRADVLGVGQIKFSGFQALVAKPSLDVHQVHTVPQPAGRTGLSQAVEMVFLADRACGTCNLRGLPQMIFPLLDRRFAVSAVQPGTLGDGLELAEEVALRVSMLIHKNPAAMRRILFPLLEQFNQFGGQRNPAFLVMLPDKVDIFFAVTCHMVFAMFPVNVVPRGVLHFLFAAGGVQKE